MEKIMEILIVELVRICVNLNLILLLESIRY